MSWQLKQKQQQVLAKEQGALVYPPGSRQGFALIYPNTYHVGMSNLGFHIIYQQINSRGDTACERLFLPDRGEYQEYIRTHTPLITLETQRPLYDFPLIGFAVTYEMDYFNILDILALGRVPLKSEDRDESHPFVIIGGPCATFNPEPLADFIDAAVIGEGEEVIHEFLDTYYQCRREGLSRRETLLRLAGINGIYVPQFYQPAYHENGTIREIQRHPAVPERVQRRWVKNLEKYPAQTVVVTPDTEFQNMFLIEVARGCGRHCRFCMAGYCYRQPRVRPLAQLAQALEAAKKYLGKVGLMGAAISDYPEINQLSQMIIEQGLTFSVASLRADSLTPGLVSGLAASGHKTVTLAPEAGSMRMRQVINKSITNEHLFQSVSMAVRAGIPHIRLYIMVGLPFEQDDDIEAVVVLAESVKAHMEKMGSKGKLTLSINPFIPKPFTPFQWLPMANITAVEGKLKYIRTRFKQQKAIEVLTETPKEAYIQGVLARGDRRLAAVLLEAHTQGGVKAWKKAVKTQQLDEAFYLYRQRCLDELLPWQTLDMGFDVAYLVRELENAERAVFTAPCVQGCVRCGICQ